MPFAQIPNNGTASPVPEVDQDVNVGLSHAALNFTSWRFELHPTKPEVKIILKLLHVCMPSLHIGFFIQLLHEDLDSDHFDYRSMIANLESRETTSCSLLDITLIGSTE